jgi:hypothetical protein
VWQVLQKDLAKHSRTTGERGSVAVVALRGASHYEASLELELERESELRDLVVGFNIALDGERLLCAPERV